MNDSTDTEPSPADDDDAAAPRHPLERAHQFFQKAAPVIREVNETLERHGGVEGVCDKVVERANELVQKVDEAVANATAIEGEVIEREPAPTPDPVPPARHIPPVTPVPQRRASKHWIAVGALAAAATYGALRLQNRD